MKSTDAAHTSGSLEGGGNQPAASVSPIRRLGAVVFVDIAGVSILFFGLLMVLPIQTPGMLPRVVMVAVLVALVRIIGEVGWGSSPGKQLSDLRVDFRDRAGSPVTGLERVLPAIIRNAWLWLPVLFTVFAVENIVSGLGVTIVASVLLRKDGRTLTDRLGGARVVNAAASEKGAR